MTYITRVILRLGAAIVHRMCHLFGSARRSYGRALSALSISQQLGYGHDLRSPVRTAIAN